MYELIGIRHNILMMQFHKNCNAMEKKSNCTLKIVILRNYSLKDLGVLSGDFKGVGVQMGFEILGGARAI